MLEIDQQKQVSSIGLRISVMIVSAIAQDSMQLNVESSLTALLLFQDLSFWANGTFNLCLNSCLFSNPSGAQELFDEQLRWMEDRLEYATSNNATHIFVYGHFPWFLKHEEEADDFLTSYSLAPEGWGPAGKFKLILVIYLN